MTFREEFADRVCNEMWITEVGQCRVQQFVLLMLPFMVAAVFTVMMLAVLSILMLVES